jgi:uncharacterized membrane protein HdeD (DUF308 family)
MQPTTFIWLDEGFSYLIFTIGVAILIGGIFSNLELSSEKRKSFVVKLLMGTFPIILIPLIILFSLGSIQYSISTLLIISMGFLWLILSFFKYIVAFVVFSVKFIFLSIPKYIFKFFKYAFKD